MTDLFEEKSKDWDGNDFVRQLSLGIGRCILDNIPMHDTMEVMDFGAGTGLITGQVAPHVSKITAVDISPAMLEKLADKTELMDKVDICCHDIMDMPLDARFDLIMSAMALHHVEDTATLFQRFAEHLKPGGLLALADLDKEDGTFHPEEAEGVFHQGFERQALAELLTQAGFKQIQFITAHTAVKEDKAYPIFLLTATLDS